MMRAMSEGTRAPSRELVERLLARASEAGRLPLASRLRDVRRAVPRGYAAAGRVGVGVYSDPGGTEPPPSPEVPAIGPEQRLVLRSTLGPSRFDLELVETLGYDGYLDFQLDDESIDDGELEAAIAEFLPAVGMSVLELLETYAEENPNAPTFHLLLAAVFRAIYSPRQLFERMVVFWTDHFNIDLFSQFQNFLKPVDDREVIRRHAMGRFPDLLRASAHSPAMLSYLTNDSNDKDHPNENYARELMELHTMGADNGYTQEDVREVARCFTGWTIWGRDGGPLIGTFRFDPRLHDFGSKVVLGQHIPAGGGEEDGLTVLDILAHHPNTAEFVSRKLLHYMWGYDPPQDKVDAVAEEYLATGGDIRSMLRVGLQRSWMKEATPKLKRPFHMLVSALRGLDAQAERPDFLLDALYFAGQLPFVWPTPNGYPDSAGYWAGFVLARWNIASVLLQEDLSGVSAELEGLDPGKTARQLTHEIDHLLFNDTLRSSTFDAVLEFLRAAPRTKQRIAEAVGLALASPDFQEY